MQVLTDYVYLVSGMIIVKEICKEFNNLPHFAPDNKALRSDRQGKRALETLTLVPAVFILAIVFLSTRTAVFFPKRYRGERPQAERSC